MDLGERKAGAAELFGRVLGEEGVVAAGRLGPALQHMPGDHGPREPVVVVGPPPEVSDGRPGDQGGIGDPPGDHDIGPRIKTSGDPEATEIGVRGKGVRIPPGEIVPLDMRDPYGYPEPVGQLPYGVGESSGIQSPGVGDDPHPALLGEPETLLQLLEEGTGVPGAGVLQPVPSQDEHGQLGEVVTGEEVQLTAGEHLAEGVEAVAVEAGGVAYAEGGDGGGHCPAPFGFGGRPVPGGPAKAWAMSSQRSASGPTASTARSVRWARWVTRRQKSRAGPVTRWGASSGP